MIKPVRNNKVSEFSTYFQTENNQAEVSLCRNLEIRVVSYLRLQELRHLDSLRDRNE